MDNTLLLMPLCNYKTATTIFNKHFNCKFQFTSNKFSLFWGKNCTSKKII